MDTPPRSGGNAPQAHDSVAAWFDPLLSERLAQAGFGTLQQLAQRINDAGVTWWYPVRGIGVRRAERVVQWLREQQESTGMQVDLRCVREHGRARPAPCDAAPTAAARGSDNARFVSAATEQG
ncbi:phage integrase family protein [Variovorax atrisoli]|uniref:phage integrase family protein n=1 Tax=Variovorax atrisoli TaxID=3394203 RepID=UPI003393B385